MAFFLTLIIFRGNFSGRVYTRAAFFHAFIIAHPGAFCKPFRTIFIVSSLFFPPLFHRFHRVFNRSSSAFCRISTVSTRDCG